MTEFRRGIKAGALTGIVFSFVWLAALLFLPVKPGSIRVSPQGETTEKTSPGEEIPVPVIGGIIVIIVAVSAFVAYRKH